MERTPFIPNAWSARALKMKKKIKSASKPKLTANIGGLSGELTPLYRPARLKYVRRMLPDKGCVFCQAASSGVRLASLCVYQSEHSMVVLNKYPYNSGHILVLPKMHIGKISELSNNVYLDLMLTLKLATSVLETCYRPSGLNLGLNQGAAAGAGIPDHLHFHVIPRWSGDLNFFPLTAKSKVVIEELQTTYKKLKSGFSKIETL